MDDAFILRHVDHTLLKATATINEIEQLCNEALEHKTASVCIPPHYVHSVKQRFPELNICTVIGFPLGYDTTYAKAAAAHAAIEDGARELDMVINLADVKNSSFASVSSEISALRKIAGTRVLKVIVETCYLTEPEKIALCGIVTDAGADFIKTSTGFGTAGATMDDIVLFKAHIGKNVRIKASGGIRSREDMMAFLEAGCSRLGTSSAISILKP